MDSASEGSVKIKLSIDGCLATSEFICATELRGRSREIVPKAMAKPAAICLQLSHQCSCQNFESKGGFGLHNPQICK